MILPEYGFGSWLKENAGGLLKGAGSLVSVIPGVGQIAGPILNVAGAAVDTIKQNKADKELAAQTQKDIDLKAAADKQLALQNELAIRNQNLFSEPDIAYGGTFAKGGSLIKPENRGKFTRWAKRHNMSVAEATKKVLANKEEYSPGVVRMANFSRNFGGHELGGDLLMNPQVVEYSDKADKHSEGIGGVPVDMKGNPAKTSQMSPIGMTEGGEITYNGYVFSNKIKVKS